MAAPPSIDIFVELTPNDTLKKEESVVETATRPWGPLWACASLPSGTFWSRKIGHPMSPPIQSGAHILLAIVAAYSASYLGRGNRVNKQTRSFVLLRWCSGCCDGRNMLVSSGATVWHKYCGACWSSSSLSGGSGGLVVVVVTEFLRCVVSKTDKGIRDRRCLDKVLQVDSDSGDMGQVSDPSCLACDVRYFGFCTISPARHDRRLPATLRLGRCLC